MYDNQLAEYVAIRSVGRIHTGQYIWVHDNRLCILDGPPLSCNTFIPCTPEECTACIKIKKHNAIIGDQLNALSSTVDEMHVLLTKLISYHGNF